mmetsp:Transcript_32068/g.63570  ORF Transcript_32068/g.63570 Transcript_32068/m.63570 type:complete len:122 (-) Transcript_32068:448-813(-)
MDRQDAYLSASLQKRVIGSTGRAQGRGNLVEQGWRTEEIILLLEKKHKEGRKEGKEQPSSFADFVPSLDLPPLLLRLCLCLLAHPSSASGCSHTALLGRKEGRKGRKAGRVEGQLHGAGCG